MLNNKIKMYRAAKDISQDELAKLVGVTRQTISAVEKNKYSPSLELAFKICKVLEKVLTKYLNIIKRKYLFKLFLSNNYLNV
ncbi:helix-turn-helix transcriptional regulator [Bacillus megaterium]|nr:helix-turn-helix transcriptional regulator [Priestia megaterium]